MTRRSIFFVFALSLPFLLNCGPRYRYLTQPSRLTKRNPPTFFVRFDTTQGPFTIEVQRDWSPRGSARLYNLVRAGFYDGVRFHRAVPNFVAQFGISPNPTVTQAWTPPSVRMEDDPVRQSNTRGWISFAASGPNTRTTQLYVNLRDNSRLDKLGFAPVARVIAGMETIDKLYYGYGEPPPRGSGPLQPRIRTDGEPYLARDFPKLDKIVRARIVKSTTAKDTAKESK